MLALFAVAILIIMLLPPPPVSWTLLVSVPEMLFLLVTLASLAAVSLGVALVFLRRGRQAYLRGPALKILVLALPVLALSWNLVAPLFWLLPAFFAWRAVNAAQS